MDSKTNEVVALKVEKPNKSKRILAFEFQVLMDLQGLPHICPVYEYIRNDNPQGLNFIVMKMLGKNLSNIKKQGLWPEAALEILVIF